MGSEIERPAVLAKMQEAASTIGAIVDVAELETPEAEQQAGEFLRRIKTLLAEAEDERKRVKAPYLAACREIDALFRQPRRELERVGKMVRRRLAEAAERRQEAARRLASPEGTEGTGTATAPVQRAPETPGVSMRWRWEIAEADLDRVPAEYVIRRLDEARVRAAIRDAEKEGVEPSIPGITFRRAAVPVARRIS